MHLIPCLRLRASEEAEIVGIDDAEMGEFAYDYVESERETSPSAKFTNDNENIIREHDQHKSGSSIVEEKLVRSAS